MLTLRTSQLPDCPLNQFFSYSDCILIIVEKEDRKIHLLSSTLISVSFLHRRWRCEFNVNNICKTDSHNSKNDVQPCNGLAVIRRRSLWLKLLMETLSWCCSVIQGNCQFITSFISEVIFKLSSPSLISGLLIPSSLSILIIGKMPFGVERAGVQEGENRIRHQKCSVGF